MNMAMGRFDYLNRRRLAELKHAELAENPAIRARHEDLARAYAKIISVLQREEASSPLQQWQF
ncbi:hypothetical protein H3V42_08205 [Sphingobium yanoikuyae]|jgi:hypothetical protein|uniref:Uncharacterized protein n=3 Tax=Sphingobium yanoikuyae TaxID=13690 RepID=A0A9X7UC44_SPHYA|nr:hypothetical protein H3V42_08205 [Sphingobium yanoikuyae]